MAINVEGLGGGMFPAVPEQQSWANSRHTAKYLAEITVGGEAVLVIDEEYVVTENQVPKEHFVGEVGVTDSQETVYIPEDLKGDVYLPEEAAQFGMHEVDLSKPPAPGYL